MQDSIKLCVEAASPTWASGLGAGQSDPQAFPLSAFLSVDKAACVTSSLISGAQELPCLVTHPPPHSLIAQNPQHYHPRGAVDRGAPTCSQLCSLYLISTGTQCKGC